MLKINKEGFDLINDLMGSMELDIEEDFQPSGLLLSKGIEAGLSVSIVEYKTVLEKPSLPPSYIYTVSIL